MELPVRWLREYLVRGALQLGGDVLLRASVVRPLKELERSQWYSAGQLRELQNCRLRGLLQHAYRSVPYYRELFALHGLSLNQVQTVEDLKLLPPLTKDIVRNRQADLRSVDWKSRRPFCGATSGSTGAPLHYLLDRDAAGMGWACNYRAWRWAGFEFGDSRVTLGGSSLVPGGRPSLANRIRDLTENNLRLSAFDMDDDAMSAYVQALNRRCPRFLRGYASALALLASHCEKAGLRPFSPHAVFTTAEMLHPHQRELIERVFGAPVYDQYGCSDGGANACECEQHQGHHIATERAVVEEVGQPFEAFGIEEGELLLTDLHNYSMPFIRYAVGDRGAVSDEPCACGRGLPLLKQLMGRSTEFVVAPSGKKIHGEFFSHIFWELQGFREFQVVQRNADSIVISVVPDERFGKTARERDAQRVRSIVGERAPELAVTIEEVTHIERSRSGKLRFVMSSVSQV